MIEYHVEEDCDNSESAAAPTEDMEFLSSFSARVASTRPSAVWFKSELDRYLEDELVSLETKGFKVLDWWKVAGVRYPTLRRIAKDIYAIPITTVASESAFSTSEKVLSEHHSRLTSKMIEALMCSQDWLRNKYKSMSILFFCSLILFTLILSNYWFFFLVDNKEKEAATFWSCLQDIQEGLQELELWAKQVYRHGYWWLQVHHLFTWTACILAPAGCVIAIVLCNWCFPLEHVLLYKFWYLNMAYCHC